MAFLLFIYIALTLVLVKQSFLNYLLFPFSLTKRFPNTWELGVPGHRPFNDIINSALALSFSRELVFSFSKLLIRLPSSSGHALLMAGVMLAIFVMIGSSSLIRLSRRFASLLIPYMYTLSLSWFRRDCPSDYPFSFIATRSNLKFSHSIKNACFVSSTLLQKWLLKARTASFPRTKNSELFSLDIKLPM